jgi:hypothetical protein
MTHIALTAAIPATHGGAGALAFVRMAVRPLTMAARLVVRVGRETGSLIVAIQGVLSTTFGAAFGGYPAPRHRDCRRPENW